MNFWCKFRFKDVKFNNFLISCYLTCLPFRYQKKISISNYVKHSPWQSFRLLVNRSTATPDIQILSRCCFTLRWRMTVRKWTFWTHEKKGRITTRWKSHELWQVSCITCWRGGRNIFLFNAPFFGDCSDLILMFRQNIAIYFSRSLYIHMHVCLGWLFIFMNMMTFLYDNLISLFLIVFFLYCCYIRFIQHQITVKCYECTSFYFVWGWVSE